jgi:hypothetical protein
MLILWFFDGGPGAIRTRDRPVSQFLSYELRPTHTCELSDALTRLSYGPRFHFILVDKNACDEKLKRVDVKVAVVNIWLSG